MPVSGIKDFDEMADKYEQRLATTEVTIKHLMTHTAGFAYWFNSARLFYLGKEKGLTNLGSIHFITIQVPCGHMELQLYF